MVTPQGTSDEMKDDRYSRLFSSLYFIRGSQSSLLCVRMHALLGLASTAYRNISAVQILLKVQLREVRFGEILPKRYAIHLCFYILQIWSLDQARPSQSLILTTCEAPTPEKCIF